MTLKLERFKVYWIFTNIYLMVYKILRVQYEQSISQKAISDLQPLYISKIFC